MMDTKIKVYNLAGDEFVARTDSAVARVIERNQGFYEIGLKVNTKMWDFDDRPIIESKAEAIDTAICRMAQIIEEAVAIKKALEAEYQRSLG